MQRFYYCVFCRQILIGFDRGLIVLWNVAQNDVQRAYISLQVCQMYFLAFSFCSAGQFLKKRFQFKVLSFEYKQHYITLTSISD